MVDIIEKSEDLLLKEGMLKELRKEEEFNDWFNQERKKEMILYK